MVATEGKASVAPINMKGNTYMASVAVYLVPSGVDWITDLTRQTQEHSEVTLAIAPSSDRFDDFGTQAAISLYVIFRGRAASITAKMILKKSTLNTIETSTSRVLRQLTDRPIELKYALKDYEFLTAVASRMDYRSAVNFLGPELAKEALVAIHDVGALMHFSPGASDLRTLRELPAFGQSLLRYDEAFIAAFDVPALFSVTSHPDLPETLNFRARAPQLENDQGILISFDTNVLEKNRICVLVGENGVGKTHVLNNIGEMFGIDTPEVPDGANFRPRQVVKIPSPLDHHPDQDRAYHQLHLGRLTINSHPSTKHGWRNITGKLAKFVRGDSSGVLLDEYALLKRALAPFFDFDNLALPVRDATPPTVAGVLDHNGRSYVRPTDYEFTSEGLRTEFFGYIDTEAPPAFIEDGKIFPLSSGERALLGLAVIILHDIGRGDLVLLDEPELSLHPRMIAELMRLLGFTLNARDAYCVIATHSIYVIREIPSDGVHVLQKKENGKTADYFPMLATLGAGLTELSNVVFNDVHIREYFTVRIESAVDRAGPNLMESLLPEIRRLVGETGIRTMKKALDAHNNKDIVKEGKNG